MNKSVLKVNSIDLKLFTGFWHKPTYIKSMIDFLLIEFKLETICQKRLGVIKNLEMRKEMLFL